MVARPWPTSSTVTRAAPCSTGTGRQQQAASTITNPAARPDHGSGASIAAVPTSNAAHATGARPATAHVANDHEAGSPISGQVNSTRLPVQCSSSAPAAGQTSAVAQATSTRGTTPSVYSGMASMLTPADTSETE